MKKFIFYLVFSFLFISVPSFAADAKARQFHGSGEVLTVDPMYSQVTIQHTTIKDFSGGGDGDFYVSDAAMLKGIQKGDLVEFEITDNKGDMKINKITKVGTAPPKRDSTPVGQALQEMLQGTGEVVKGVTSPIAPAHDVAGGVMDATTDATGNVLNEQSPEAKTKF